MIAKSFALGFTLAVVAAGAAEAQSRLPTGSVRDHRGPSGMSGGGVSVTNTPGRFGGYGRNPIIRDHRGSCEFGIRRPGGCAS